MNIISWNINGIRAGLKNGLLEFVTGYQPDILCLQETKIHDNHKERQIIKLNGYNSFWHGAQRPGYSGTAIFIKEKYANQVISYQNFEIVEFDHEGRVQILELLDFYLINAYFPNANNELSRLDYKQAFNQAMLKKIKVLEKIKPVVLTGDLNVAHQPIDLANPKQNMGCAGFTVEEREDMNKFIVHGLKDTFRELNGAKIQYTWWSYRFGVRERNIGWRIDYFLVSSKILKNVKAAFILDKVKGSDHCPIGIDFEYHL